LYLREGITLKAHLQTHSKEKVIEALPYKQDPSSCIPSNDDSGLLVLNASAENDAASSSNVENRFFASVNRTNLGVSALSSPFVHSPNNQVGQTTQPLSYDGNSVQYPPILNNLLSQPSVNSSCNAVLTYQSYMTNEGNIILIPVYNMCPPSVMLSSNIVPTTGVVNPCVVMPPSNAVDSVNTNDVVSSATLDTSCLNAVGNHEMNEDEVDCHSVGSADSYENEKATDEEVANIFKITKRKGKYNGRKGSKSSDSVSYCDSEITANSKSDDESNGTTYLESEVCSLSSSPSERSVGVGQTSITPNVSVIRVRNDLNYRSSVDEGTDRDDDESYSPLPSTSTNSVVTTVISSSNLVEQQRKCEILDLSDGRHGSASSPELEDEEYDEDEYPEDVSELSTLIKEKECYILPNSDIPRLSPAVVGGDFNFISKNLLTSASLISTVNKAMFASDKNSANFFEKCEVIKGEEKQISTRTLTNYIMKLTDKEDEDYRMNVNENFGSASSSRISPFDIQTDESMPARGELSGQDSLSSTENSIWELQVSFRVKNKKFRIL
jgi:hypothetical protein